jgi:hypothetical protein
MAEQKEGFVTAFGGSILNVRNRLPFTRLAGYEQLDIILLERLDLLLRPPRRREAALPL